MAQFEPADYPFSYGFLKNKDMDRIFVITDPQFKIAQTGMLANHKVLHLLQKNLLFKWEFWIITANCLISL